ncbi:hypothetical protein IC617_02245 [Neiella sp. HB171785]|uniref:Uncharacterized protein n=1 Tax=Neiella litorisoli TaxID=2771431 RepID=A0A8J6R1U4_9GAMM|nr:hypothetical protein [Neiella litorisoli]MBD1388240.1 hypothetical protein [Neiella litorisoli]
MFDRHNVATKTLVTLLTLSSLLGFLLFGYMVLPEVAGDDSGLYLYQALLTGLLAWMISRKSIMALRITGVLSLVQIIEIEAQSWSLGVGAPLKILLSWQANGIEYGVNLYALFIMLLIWLAYRKFRQQDAAEVSH